ncbi:hypothetical protein [Hymenobacter latericus]|uniref:hypothetical protein n=1 Tax=Hymenobacter sp. YIM 151858-1 TaxID=2987688 RepID=UPI002227891B|nr:hypothetical protein [Hymenobacter sp. YIM 151858-1]UYZ59654.1 hypothetical protein OIS50_02385 [Hymenobacter sp. YIM 151858-1]
MLLLLLAVLVLVALGALVAYKALLHAQPGTAPRTTFSPGSQADYYSFRDFYNGYGYTKIPRQ